jgi:hypothetical protein
MMAAAIPFHAGSVRIPTHPVGCSDNIRSVIPGYPVTEDRCRSGMVFDVRRVAFRQRLR